MDERITSFKFGTPVPEWDVTHRLPIDVPVGPEVKDSATVFRTNSTYMDISDQPYLERQMTAFGVLIGCIATAMAAFILYMINFMYPKIHSNGYGIYANILFTPFLLAFIYTTFIFGRDEFFSLTRRTIRFNRKNKMIYAIRRRRFFATKDEGDIVWQTPWNDESFFCIHKGPLSQGYHYHIRCYMVDKNGNVLKAFSLGRSWDTPEDIESLLSQWNYWCWYMNNGPAKLPLPPLFFSEQENLTETFLFCLYSMGYEASYLARVIMLPVVLIMTGARLLAMWTCRDPIWPTAVENVSAVETDDPYDQPRGNTPVGWAQTAIARQNQTYPFDPKMKLDGWRGEPNGAANARLWAQDIAPTIKRTDEVPINT